METDRISGGGGGDRGARGGGDRSSYLVVADDDEFDRQEAARLACEVNLSAPPPKAATATGTTAAANDERYPQNTVREHVIWHASCIDDVLSDRGTWNAVDATTTTCARS